MASNPRSISVEITGLSNESNARATADAHCRKHGRYAVLAQDRGNGKFDYECVA